MIDRKIREKILQNFNYYEEKRSINEFLKDMTLEELEAEKSYTLIELETEEKYDFANGLKLMSIYITILTGLFVIFGSDDSSLPGDLIGLGIFAFILIIGYSFWINQREKYEIRNKKIKISKYKLELDCIEKLINEKNDAS